VVFSVSLVIRLVAGIIQRCRSTGVEDGVKDGLSGIVFFSTSLFYLPSVRGRVLYITTNVGNILGTPFVYMHLTMSLFWSLKKGLCV
jgi:hypothetical protein